MNLPLEHLSSSSLTLHMKCPRQWQDRYLFGNRGTSNSSLLIGSAVHEALNRLFSGKEVGNYFDDTINKEIDKNNGIDNIVWKDNIEKAQKISEQHVYDYWNTVGKHLADDVVSTERELLFDIEGVGLPILGFVDLELTEDLIDYKTTAATSKGWVKVNKDWVFQQGLYQLVIPKPSQVHILTRAKESPIIVPKSTSDKFYFGLIDGAKIAQAARDEWARIEYHWERYGMDSLWPGNVTHEWASRYCQVENCCAL